MDSENSAPSKYGDFGQYEKKVEYRYISLGGNSSLL